MVDELREVSATSGRWSSAVFCTFHRLLRDGVPVEYPRPDGSIADGHARQVDFGDVQANDGLAVNQVMMIDGQHNIVTRIADAIDLLPTLTSVALGKITLPAGQSPLILRALDIPGTGVMDDR